jgi:hypothetical protein
MVAGVPQEERAQIDAVQRRLAEKYTEFPRDHVVAVVQRVHARFNERTVRDYVPLLVERRATEELSRSNFSEAVSGGGAGGCATGGGTAVTVVVTGGDDVDPTHGTLAVHDAIVAYCCPQYANR